MNAKEGVPVLSAKSGGVEVKVQRQGDLAIFRCMGYIDTYNSSDFTAAVKGMIQQGCTRLLFDLAEVNYISSTGVGSFTNFLKEVKPLGGDMVLARPTERVLEVIKLLGFLTFFIVTDSMEEALEYFPVRTQRSVPFAKMELITDTFGRLERFVVKDKQPEFYNEVITVLREIEELRRTVA